MTSPPARNRIRFANTASKSRSVLACRTWSCRPRVRAAVCRFLVFISARAGSVGLTRCAKVLAVGTSSCNNSSRFGATSVHLTMNQISRQCGQPFVLIPGEAIFDSDVLTLDKACVFQTLTERGEELWGVVGRPGGEDPDHRHRRLLRACRERHRSAAEQRDELAASHSITSSARANSDGGTSSPSAFAVLRLMTSSYLVGVC